MQTKNLLGSIFMIIGFIGIMINITTLNLLGIFTLIPYLIFAFSIAMIKKEKTIWLVFSILTIVFGLLQFFLLSFSVYAKIFNMIAVIIAGISLVVLILQTAR